MKLNNKLLYNLFIFILIILVVLRIILFLIGQEISNININLALRALFFIVLIWFIITSNIGKPQFSLEVTKNILLWIIIFIILVAGYAFRFELEPFKNRFLAALIPSYSWTNDQGHIILARNQDGHFYIDAITGVINNRTNNNKIKFLIDTGATSVALTKRDAVKLGFNLSKLKYTVRYSTADGVSYAAPVTIKELTIGKRTFYNVRSHVLSGNSDISLLGMSIIDNFKSFKITRDLLILEY